MLLKGGQLYYFTISSLSDTVCLSALLLVYHMKNFLLCHDFIQPVICILKLYCYIKGG